MIWFNRQSKISTDKLLEVIVSIVRLLDIKSVYKNQSNFSTATTKNNLKSDTVYNSIKI